MAARVVSPPPPARTPHPPAPPRAPAPAVTQRMPPPPPAGWTAPPPPSGGRPAAPPPLVLGPITPGQGVSRHQKSARSGATRAVFGGVAALLLVAGGVAYAASLTHPDRGTTGTNTATGGGTATTSTGSTIPADEQCTTAIMNNPRWVCLTSATFDGTTLTIRFRAEFDGDLPSIKKGYHLHLYGGNGVTPTADIEGRQSATPGHWFAADASPAVLKATSHDFIWAVGDAPKVCARIADAQHNLVRDVDGGFDTGNCVPIRRIAPPADSAPPQGSDGGTPAPTPTGTPTDGATDTGGPTTTVSPTLTATLVSPGPVTATKLSPALSSKLPQATP